MGEIERLLPGTKVSEWAATAIAANPGSISTGAGYFGGGGFTYLDTVNRFSFPDDSRTVLSAALSTARAALAGTANAGVAGYYGGGVCAPTWTNFDVVDKFAFSDDSRTTLGTGLSAATRWLGGMSNSGTAGYFAGGYNTSGETATVDKFAFSDDSRTTLVATLSVARDYLAGAANSGVAGYFAGGYSSLGNHDTVDKIAFSDDSRSTLGTGLSASRRALAGAANSGTAAYFAGGYE